MFGKGFCGFDKRMVVIVCKYFQAKVGRWEEFEIVLQRLRGESADISYESSEIKVKHH